MVGIAVLGASVLGLGLAQATINQMNSESAAISARIKAIEDTRYSLPSSASGDVASNCAAIKAIGAITASAETMTGVQTDIGSIRTTAASNPC